MMRRLFGVSVVTLAVCLIASSTAMAQGRGGRGGFGGGGFGGPMPASMLLVNDQVKKELKLTDDQNSKIKEITDAARPQRGAGGRNQNLTDEQRTALREEMRKRGEETAKKLAEVLTAEQNARLKQIQLWQQGTRALSNDDVVKELSLTDDQKGALKTITDESGKKRQELGQGRRNASEEERKKIDEQLAAMRTETDAECMAVLTDDQKSKFTTMKGPKPDFDLTQLFGRGGPGGGRGRRGGNNNN